jgi:protein-L-isoaspartate(D-aspartate) O-methyltransferase
MKWSLKKLRAKSSTLNSGSKETDSFSKLKKSVFSLIASFLSGFGFMRTPRTFDHETSRKNMIEIDLKPRGIVDPMVLRAMLRVPRHLFVDPKTIDLAYKDMALPFHEGQTLSQPYMVALMTQSARLKPTDRVLEVGTGSGYQAAVLAEITGQVFSLEIINSLAVCTAKLLSRLGYSNIHTRQGDGYRGWAENAPFDAILITAATPKIPQHLIEQLKMGGRLVMPLGKDPRIQDLVVLTKSETGLEKESVAGVVFVPMTGEIRQ